jgi:hypothetical protein
MQGQKLRGRDDERSSTHLIVDEAHNKALKAVARKRLGVIFAIMRDKVPYAEPAADCSKPGAQGKRGVPEMFKNCLLRP